MRDKLHHLHFRHTRTKRTSRLYVVAMLATVSLLASDILASQDHRAPTPAYAAVAAHVPASPELPNKFELLKYEAPATVIAPELEPSSASVYPSWQGSRAGDLIVQAFAPTEPSMTDAEPGQ